MEEFIYIILAYLIGSVPTALWIGRWFFGIDIRQYGSGNSGATNTFRVLGKSWGTYVMIVDIVKGVFAASLYLFMPEVYYGEHNELQRTNFQLILGLSAVAGHIFPIWAGFKGGKGVATLFGLLIALQPVVALSCVAVFLLVLYITRYVSLSSILASMALPIFIILVFREHEVLYRVFAVLIAILVIVTHQKNIIRLLNGDESRVPILKYRDRRKTKRRNKKNEEF
jgi:acyl phosphate:glycerol-3-phosphate acyltransferase